MSVTEVGVRPAASVEGAARKASRLLKSIRKAAMSLWALPAPARLALVACLALYLPVYREAAELWYLYPAYSHGFLIFPISLGLVWMLRGQIAGAQREPAPIGLAVLAGGLLLETASYLLRIKFLAAISLVPVAAGLILALHGMRLWKVLRFPVWFLAFAAPLPGTLLDYPSHWIQNISSIGAAQVVQVLGYPILRQGNVIQIPGMSLEVAEACSGFQKLFALVAFSILYGYLFDLPLWKRLVLLAAVLPIALAANITRISALVAVSYSGGPHWLHLAHDSAEVFVVAISCVFFVTLGRYIGCDKTRFSP